MFTGNHNNNSNNFLQIYVKKELKKVQGLYSSPTKATKFKNVVLWTGAITQTS
jgi:hypothetical protein